MQKKSVKKLTLSRESLRVLADDRLLAVAGGDTLAGPISTCVPYDKRFEFITE
jgi:hypothetical protein